MMDTTLAKLDKATQMLSEIKNIDDVKKLVNLAEAARVYAREVERSLEAQNYAAEIKLRAQRRGGEILAKMEKQNGGDATRARLQRDTEQKPTLDDLGISKADSSRWQQIAQLPVKQFEAVIAETKEASGELTTASMLREVQAVKREEQHADKIAQPIPAGKFRVIYADPPWQYNTPQHTREAQETILESHYPTMPLEDICALPITDLANDDAVLFLWATSPLLEQALEVMRSWGFKYKSAFIWDKVRHNVGYYNSVRHEFLLIGTRGSCLPDDKPEGEPKLIDSVQSIERGEHSVKPEEFRNIIDYLYPTGTRIELFARGELPAHWEKWGNE
jgi:N6-adenosine-specific RNA methylase IME4